MKSMLKTACFSMLGLTTGPMLHAQSNYWIIGGQTATEGQFPWLGDIRVPHGAQRYHHCGSTLIHPYWVLTAAHCLLGSDVPTHVRFNTVNTNTPNVNPNGGIEVEIDTFYRHMSFNPNMSLGNGYDIGLIRLKQPVTSIATIAMPQHGDTALYYAANRAVLIAGWGLTDTVHMIPADIMKWANSKIIGRVKCNQYYQGSSGQPQVSERVVCVGYEGAEAPSGSAAGDSGGPLWIDSNGTKYIIGLVSGGSGPTTRHERPGIFTNVAYFRPWIDSVMNMPPTSITRSNSFNDENVRITADEQNIKLTIGNVSSANIFVQLSNVAGTILYKQNFTHPKFQTYQINTSGFAAGMYVIRIYDNAGNHMYRKLHHVGY